MRKRTQFSITPYPPPTCTIPYSSRPLQRRDTQLRLEILRQLLDRRYDLLRARQTSRITIDAV
jgi:hypothetical protein